MEKEFVVEYFIYIKGGREDFSIKIDYKIVKLLYFVCENPILY